MKKYIIPILIIALIISSLCVFIPAQSKKAKNLEQQEELKNTFLRLQKEQDWDSVHIITLKMNSLKKEYDKY